MDGKNRNLFKAQQKAASHAGQTPIPFESEDFSNTDPQTVYKSIDLRDSTSEWEKQKEALKKINNSINNKDRKHEENGTDHNPTHPSE
jgi:predicted transglutaminase-like cysteine proteinase